MKQNELPDSADALCILGFERLDLSFAAQWVEQNRNLYLVDNFSNQPIVARGLEKIPHHPRVHIWSIETPLQHEQIIKEIAWHAVLQTMHIQCQAGWEELGQRLRECHHAAHLLLSETADFGRTAFSNARINWRENGPFRSWSALHRRFQNIPAIICGAGPSLQEASSHLTELSSHALLLSAGTAGSILGEWGVTPHLACFLDKETPLAHILKEPAAEIGACLQSRLNPACAHWLHGEKILAPESGPLPWEQWWMDQDSSPSFGWTVGNFATQLALWMGCNPIIWVGMDFCYQDNQKYAGRNDAKEVPLIECRGRMTQRDWLMAARWSEELACDHPENRFINTSLQGLPLQPPIETISLTAIELTKQFDLSGQLHQALQVSDKLMLTHSQKEEKWVESWQRCQILCSDPMADVGEPISQEPVYIYYLEPLWRIWRPLFDREAKNQNMECHRLLFFQQVLQNEPI